MILTQLQNDTHVFVRVHDPESRIGGTGAWAPKDRGVKARGSDLWPPQAPRWRESP